MNHDRRFSESPDFVFAICLLFSSLKGDSNILVQSLSFKVGIIGKNKVWTLRESPVMVHHPLLNKLLASELPRTIWIFHCILAVRVELRESFYVPLWIGKDI